MKAIAFVALSALSTNIAMACSVDVDLPLRDSLTLDLAPGESRLVVVHQRNEDLRIGVGDPRVLWLDSPGGRNVPEFILVEAPEAGGEVELCLHSAFANSPAGNHETEILTLDSPVGQAKSFFSKLGQANAAWAEDPANNAPFVIYNELIDTAPQLFDMPYLVRLFTAIALMETSNFQEAEGHLQYLLENFPGHRYAYMAKWHLGQVYRQDAKRELAIATLHEAIANLDELESGTETNLSMDRADMLNLLGLVHTENMDLVEGEQFLQEALEYAKPDFSLMGRIYNNLSFVTLQKTRIESMERASIDALLEQSLEEHLIARELLLQSKNLDSLLMVENNIAILYDRMGETRKGLVHFLKALELLEEYETVRAKNLIYHNLWNIYTSLGEHRKAASYLQEILEINENSNYRFSSFTRCRLGSSLFNLGDLDGAVQEHNQCLEISRLGNLVDQQIEALISLSGDNAALGNIEQALSDIRTAYGMLDDLEDENILPRLLLQYAQVQFGQGNLQEAAFLIQDALDRIDGIRYPEAEIELLALGMKVERGRGNYVQAEDFGEQALAGIEKLHTQLSAERQGPAWSDKTHDIYIALAELYLDRYLATGNSQFLESAFVTSERSHAINLRQQLASPLPEDLTTLEDQKQIEIISKISSTLAGTGVNFESGSSLATDYYLRHNLLSLSRLAKFDSLPIPRVHGSAEIRARLGEHQLALSYLATGSTLYLFVLDSNTFKLLELGSMTDLQASIRQLARSLRSPQYDPATDLLFRDLSRSLLPGEIELVGYEELLVVPHTGLYNFPFSMLGAGSGDEYNPLAGFLPVRVLPSIGASLLDRPEREEGHTLDIVSIADPVFSKAQLVSRFSQNPDPADYRGWTEELAPLPFTAREAESLELTFSGKNVKSFTGRQATRANLISTDARLAKILHIATHGYFNSTSDDNIGLALSVIDEAGNDDPGFITLTELFGYSFRNQLVVISGCETALGAEQAGVGLNSLTRGFLAQGAKHVISTLWPVSDRASAEFMKIFYQQLKETMDVSVALQKAQKQLRESERYSSPFYWAGYVLQSASDSTQIRL